MIHKVISFCEINQISPIKDLLFILSSHLETMPVSAVSQECLGLKPD